MILPFFDHLQTPRRYPMTLFVVVINVILFTALSSVYFTSQNEIEDLLSDEQFVDVQAKIFAEMIMERPAEFAVPLQTLANEVVQGERVPAQVLGRLSLRNATFMDRAPAFAFKGDHVMYRNWQSAFHRFADLREAHPNYSFGLSSMTPGYEPYITYQFLHGGFPHLLVNMLMLILVGSVLEPSLGAAGLLVAYLGCGIIAALGFVILNGATPVPLVGASGSIMGLFGFLMGLKWREPLRFIWFLPTTSMTGFVFLPAWILVGYFVVSDLAGFIEVETWLGTGVAHAAHLSGFVAGALVGYALRKLRFDQIRNSTRPPELRAWVAPPR